MFLDLFADNFHHVALAFPPPLPFLAAANAFNCSVIQPAIYALLFSITRRELGGGKEPHHFILKPCFISVATVYVLLPPMVLCLGSAYPLLYTVANSVLYLDSVYTQNCK